MDNFNSGNGNNGDLPSALALTEPEIISIQTQIVLSNGSSASSSASTVHFPHHLHNHQHSHQNNHNNIHSSSNQATSGASSTSDSRYRVSHANHRQWFLHIKQIKPSDRGEILLNFYHNPFLKSFFQDITCARSIPSQL